MDTGPGLRGDFARAFKAGTSIKFNKKVFLSDMWETIWNYGKCKSDMWEISWKLL